MSKSIIIADDDPVVRHILQAILQQKNYIVSCFENGSDTIEGLKSAAQNNALPDILFLDFFLGDLTAKEILASLDSVLSDSDVKVVLLSANTAKDLEALDSENLTQYRLEKPFTPDSVNELINSLS